jgi:hypothetical protein
MDGRWMCQQTWLVDPSHPIGDELLAAGVPQWAPRSSQASDAVFYIWSTGPDYSSYLFLRDGADRQTTIERLLEAIGEVGHGPSNSPRPTELNQPVANIVVRSGLADGTGRQLGFGPLAQPPHRLRPLREMLANAVKELRNQLSDGSA